MPSVRSPLAAHIVCALIVACFATLAAISGLTASPLVWYLALAPASAGYLLGRRSAAIWGAACLLVVAGIEVVRRAHPIEPVFSIGPSAILASLAIFVGVVVVLASGALRRAETLVRDLGRRDEAIGELERVVEQQKAELLSAQDQVSAASRAKREFLATVSHEIRTPLNGVLGMAGLLLDEDLSSRQRELVRTIRLSGDALLGVINDILDFSKIETDGWELERSPFDLREQIEDALDLFSVAAAKKGIELTATLEDGTPARVVGDCARIRQILVNLLNNAVKFTERGEVAIVVSAREEQGDPVEITCRVSDTGIGVPEDRLAQLFVPFSQGDPSKPRRFDGAGLGLAISERLARAMGGGISVESKVGVGSTFTCTFFVERDDAEMPPPVTGARKRVGVLCARRRARTMLESLLRSLSLEPVVWESAEDLCASGAACDVLVVEEQLYDDLVRLTTSDAGLPVVFLSEPGSDRSTAAADAVAVVRKPVRRAELRRALIAALDAGTADSVPPSSHLSALASEVPLRVLVAEDNAINQRVALLMLERLGYLADVAGNGVEALDAIAARPYDLILMDLRMPEMDGLEATRRILRELPEASRPRIVAMTANATAEDRQACREVGMEDFLSKPVRAPDLVRVLRATKAKNREREVVSERGSAPRPPPASAPHSQRSAAQSPASEELLDHKALAGLRKLFAAHPEDFRSMMNDYFDSAENHLSNIDDALGKGDLAAAELSAHSLKGVSGQMGARIVMAAAYEVEKATKARDLETAKSLVPALRAAHVKSRPLLLDACSEPLSVRAPAA